MTVWVGRSPLRLVSLALVGAAMVLLAVDMTIAYRFYPLPESTDVVVGSTLDTAGNTVDVTEAVYTLQGEAQRRRDLVFGAGLALGGLAALFWGVREAVSRRPLLTSDEEGVTIRVGKGGETLHLPWDDLVEARSGVRRDEGGTEPVVSLRVRHPEALPLEVRGGAVDPPWLHLYAGDWDLPAHQVAARLDSRVRPMREGEYW